MDYNLGGMRAALSAALWVTAASLLTSGGAGGVSAAAETYNLNPNYRTGLRYSVSNHSLLRYTHAKDSRYPDLPPREIRGGFESDGTASLQVAQGKGAVYDRLEIKFGDCTAKIVPVYQNATIEKNADWSRAAVVITRQAGEGGTTTSNYLVKCEEKALSPDSGQLLRTAFGPTPLADGPVAVGAEWETDRIQPVFGPALKGGMTLKLVKIRKDDHGRQVAEVAVTRGRAANHPAEGMQADNYKFEGTFLVDLETGLIVYINLDGTVTSEMPGGGTWYGTQHFDRNVAIVAVGKDPPAGDTAGGPASPFDPPAPSADFAGKFQGEGVTMELKPAGPGAYTGTVAKGDQKFPATAQQTGSHPEGTFEAGGNSLPFSADLNGRAVTFKGGRGGTNKLERVAPTTRSPFDR